MASQPRRSRLKISVQITISLSLIPILLKESTSKILSNVFALIQLGHKHTQSLIRHGSLP
jgi:hypothetical protein